MTEIEIRLEYERMNGFTAHLTQRREGHERAFSDETGFLIEFPPGARKQIPRFNVAFGYGPGALVLIAPIGASGVREQKLESRLAAENENAGADLGSA